MEGQVDVVVENHGTLFLFRPVSDQGKQWIEANVQDDAQYMGDALVVEHRYARDLAAGMQAEGLVLE